jgi:hypothetical protein
LEPQERLHSKGFDHGRNVLKLNVFAHAVLLQVLEKSISVVFVHVHPKLHILCRLIRKSGLCNNGVKHDFALDSQQAGVDCRPFRIFVEQPNIVRNGILQYLRAVTAADAEECA